jgi:hypothetical protein
MPLSFPIAEHLRKLWGGRPRPRPTPSSAIVACRALILRAESGTRASRADQWVCPALFPKRQITPTGLRCANIRRNEPDKFGRETNPRYVEAPGQRVLCAHSFESDCYLD